MTTELEKQFFETFGIGQIFDPYYGYIYPQITDRILLELICILTEWRQFCARYYIINAINIDILKNCILKDCLYMLNWYEDNKCDKGIKHRVQELFKGE